MKIVCVLGRHAYGDPARGEGYEHANFLPALAGLGHRVELFDSLGRDAHASFADLNRALIECVERLRPDAVFCVLMHYEIWTETLDRIRGAVSGPLLNWGTDDSWKYRQFARYVAPHVDLYATTSAEALAQAKRDGFANFALSQWAASSATLAEPLPSRECRIPVSFVGTAYGNRRRWIQALAARGIEVQCFGHGWDKGPVSTAEIRRIVRESSISLNFGDSGLHWRGLRPYRSRQIKARVFEVPGAGGLLLTEPAEGLEGFYRIGEEIDVFQSPDGAVAKIERYLSDPDLRDRVASAGHARTRREHTYEARFEILLRQAEAAKRASPPAHPRPLPSPELSPGLRMLRALLVLPAAVLFGPRRGARAARRFLYELSWRLCGSRTYSARGWPGRMFYRES